MNDGCTGPVLIMHGMHRGFFVDAQQRLQKNCHLDRRERSPKLLEISPFGRNDSRRYEHGFTAPGIN